MKFAKRLLMVAGAVALAGILGAMMSPKIAHAVSALVTVANTSANPVPVTMPAGTTHLGQDVNSIVNLVSVSGVNGGCFFQVPINGGAGGTCASVPSGKVLVITDIDWRLDGGSAGTDYFFQLFANFSYQSLENQADSNGIAGGQEHFTSGLVFSVMPSTEFFTGSLGPVESSTTVSIRGYFISN